MNMTSCGRNKNFDDKIKHDRKTPEPTQSKILDHRHLLLEYPYLFYYSIHLKRGKIKQKPTNVGQIAL